MIKQIMHTFKRNWKITIASIVFICVLMSLTLLSPRPPVSMESQLVIKSYKLTGSIYILINGDSYEFMLLAQSPISLLLDKERFLWQSRPMYPVLGYVTALPFRGCRKLLLEIIRRMKGTSSIYNNENQFVERLYNNLISEYLGYLTINLVLLVLSLLILYRFIISNGTFGIWFLLPASILILNEVTKAFFWTPHLQIFNVFHPLLAIDLCRRIVGGKSLNKKDIIILGFLLGLACLAYGAFLITAIAVSVALLIQKSEHSRFYKRNISKPIFLLTSASIPIMLWIGTVSIKWGKFYSHETYGHHQFIWLLESIQNGRQQLLSSLITNFTQFLLCFQL